MLNQHVAYYLGSKILAAVLNLGTMVIFIRVGGPETYGAYVVALAWAYIVYSFTLQWLRFSFFATYEDTRAEAMIATYLRLSLASLALMAAAAGALVATGLLGLERTLAVMSLVGGLAVYDALHEMGRTRLQARAVAGGVLMRALLMLVFGIISLRIDGSGTGLAIAVAAAHALAVIPLVINLAGLFGGRWSAESARTMAAYGSSIVPAYALDGVGLQLDRLLLERFGTLAEVGKYGAVADLIRQVMIVVSEAIAGAYIAIARAELKAGNETSAVAVLGHAFLAYTALAAFGCAFILRFHRLILETLFGPVLADVIAPVLPLMLASSVLLVYRSYYFGQVLYLTPDSRLLLRSNAAHCAIMASAGLLLTPVYGMFGVALALTLAHLGGCAVYVHAWRNTFALRLPYRSALTIVAIAAVAYGLTGMVTQMLGHGPLAVVINLIVLATAAMMAARRYNILSFNDVVSGAARLAASRLGRQPS